jgi:catechol 2,3-dioxygenase-like lactoylglutathione lyase family enzyme
MPMINGVHSILFTRDADAARTFFADVLGLDAVDAGGGWLIFALPPAELAVHPGDEPSCELYLMTDDPQRHARVVARARGAGGGRAGRSGLGVFAQIAVPGFGALGVYEPRHPVPVRTTQA